MTNHCTDSKLNDTEALGLVKDLLANPDHDAEHNEFDTATDAELLARMDALKVAEMAALLAEHRATMAALERRIWAVIGRVAMYSTVVPAALGAANAAGLL